MTLYQGLSAMLDLQLEGAASLDQPPLALQLPLQLFLSRQVL